MMYVFYCFANTTDPMTRTVYVISAMTDIWYILTCERLIAPTMRHQTRLDLHRCCRLSVLRCCRGNTRIQFVSR